jgi:hypothetical protein
MASTPNLEEKKRIDWSKLWFDPFGPCLFIFLGEGEKKGGNFGV